MEHLVAIMLLVGCNPDGSTCTEVPVPSPSYATAADCEADLGMQMRLSDTFDRRLVGACTTVDAALLEQSVTVEWALNRAGALLVEIKAEGPETVASLETPDTASLDQVAAQ